MTHKGTNTTRDVARHKGQGKDKRGHILTGCPRMQFFSYLLINYKGKPVAMVKMDDIIMSKNENHKPKPHQATQSIL